MGKPDPERPQDFSGMDPSLLAALKAPVGTPAWADGSWLIVRFLERNPAADAEMVVQLNRLLHRVYKQHWTGKHLNYFELRGDCFILLDYWRESGKLEVEPLAWLAQRLMKQCARQQIRDAMKDQKLRRLDIAFGADPDDKRSRGRGRKLDKQASDWYGWKNPEQELLAKELLAWLTAAREKLSPPEQATWDASVRLADGEVKSLHQALGVKEADARQRRKRMRAAIAELARKDGMTQVIDRWKAGRATRHDRKPENKRRRRSVRAVQG